MTNVLSRDDVTVLSTDLPGEHRGDWWHIQVGDKYFIVSAVDLSSSMSGYRTSETMAFPADAAGEVTSWLEVGFVDRKDHEACIADLLESLSVGES